MAAHRPLSLAPDIAAPARTPAGARRTRSRLRAPWAVALWCALPLFAVAPPLSAANADAPQTGETSWSEFHDQSLRLRDHHRFDDARAAALNALSSAEALANQEALFKCHVNLAMIASMTRAWAEAEQHLDHALRLAVDSAEKPDTRIPLLILLGDVRMEDRRPASAEPAYAEAARLCHAPATRSRPSLPPTLLALGKIALLRDDTTLAAERFAECVSVAETMPETSRHLRENHLEIAAAYAAKNRTDDAARHFTAALVEAEKNGDATGIIDVYQRLSAFHESRADHAAAWRASATVVRLWRDAARSDPTPDNRLQLALALVDLSKLGPAAGEGAAAETACREALEIATRVGGEQSDEIATFEVALANLLLDLGRLPEARQRFAAFYSRLERDTAVSDARHLDVAQAGFYQRYALLLNKAARPASAAVLDAVGASLAAQGGDDASRALAEARAALALLPAAAKETDGLPPLLRQPAPYFEWLGRVLLAQSRPAEATAACREALSSLDDSLPDHIARRARLEGDLATCLRVQKQFDEALACARRSLASWSEIRPTPRRQIAAARLVCTELLAALGRREESVAFHAETERIQEEWSRSGPDL